MKFLFGFAHAYGVAKNISPSQRRQRSLISRSKCSESCIGHFVLWNIHKISESNEIGELCFLTQLI